MITKTGRRINPATEPVIGYADTLFAYIYTHHTVRQALAFIRTEQIRTHINYFYVLDENGVLKGVVPTRKLLTSPDDKPVAELMVKSVVRLTEHSTVLNALEAFAIHRFLALPVVDSEKKLIGVVDIEFYIDELYGVSSDTEAPTPDNLFQLIGVRLADAKNSNIYLAFRNRFAWLLCNVAGGLGAAFISGAFEPVLAKFIVLSLFTPLVLTLSESVSIQTMTIAVQVLTGVKLTAAEIAVRLWREVRVGALLGLSLGVIVFAVAALWKGDVFIALVIYAAIFLTLLSASLIGLLVPAVLLWTNRNPDVASGPIALAITDTATLLIYFGGAAWLLL